MHSSPENLRAMVAKVEHWLIRKQWRKIIYGAISVQKCKETLKGYKYKFRKLEKGKNLRRNE